jgi:hypothetical protein
MVIKKLVKSHKAEHKVKPVPAWVKKTELFASQLKKFYMALYDVHRGHPPIAIVIAAAQRNFKKESIPKIHYFILEDANFHKLNDALEQAGLFQKTSDFVATKEYDRYCKLGGRTWGM